MKYDNQELERAIDQTLNWLTPTPQPLAGVRKVDSDVREQLLESLRGLLNERRNRIDYGYITSELKMVEPTLAPDE